MAKKNNTNEEVHPVQSLLHLLVVLDVDPGTIQLGYEPDGGTHVSIAVPEIRFALCLDGDKPGKLEEEKWVVQHIRYHDVAAFHKIFQAVDAVRIAQSYARSDEAMKTTSQPEEWLWKEMVRQNISPMPDRNYMFRRDDGTELTTPDFTWEKYRIAFFMDGAYWHSVHQDQQLLKELQQSKDLQKHAIDTRKDKVRKDGDIRSELAARGWIVLQCTDEDLQEEGGVYRVVNRIKQAIESSIAIGRAASAISSEERDELLEFL